jgi:MFS family permease
VRPLNRGSRSTEGVARRIAGGIKYVASHERIILILVLAIIPSFTVWGVMPLLPIVARDVLGGDAGTYGWLNGALGIGSIVGALFVAAAHGVAHKGLLAVLGAAGTGLALAGLAYTQNLYVALAFLLASGAATGVGMTLNQSLVQVLTPPDYQGRVASIFMLTWNFQPIGIILFGAVAESQGVPFAFWAAGLGMAAGTTLLAVTRPALVRLRV